MENVFVLGAAGHAEDAPRRELVTYHQAMNEDVQACFDMRPVQPPEPGNESVAGSCVEIGPVADFETSAFAHVAGPEVHGLVIQKAKVVRARLHGGGTVEMKPSTHPDLEARVFGFSVGSASKIKRLEAVSASGEVLGSTQPP